MAVFDTHLARGASNGGPTFPDRGGRYGRAKGAKRAPAIDVTGIPVGALSVPTRPIDADGVDLSATPDGQHNYEKVVFDLTRPRG